MCHRCINHSFCFLSEEDYVVSEGYCITEYDGKTVYKKSSGAINAPSYIRIKYENDRYNDIRKQ